LPNESKINNPVPWNIKQNRLAQKNKTLQTEHSQTTQFFLIPQQSENEISPERQQKNLPIFGNETTHFQVLHVSKKK
jgi:hypothetical protein